MAFTLPEALWLAENGVKDILVAYPTVNRTALTELAVSSEAAQEITLMVDDVAQLDLLESCIPEDGSSMRLCIDLDAAYPLLHGKIKLGAKRSPLHSTREAVELARAIIQRKKVGLVGLMSYEAQIASMGDDPHGKPYLRGAVSTFRKKSAQELSKRRAETVSAISALAPLEFVNGGGTGSIETTREEDSVTEIAAGSGLFAPVIFDDFKAFQPTPAAMFALPIVRKPSKSIATALGGGYISSTASRTLPTPYLPAGLKLDKQEGAGEVQTPLLGRAARKLKIGDRVYLRHAKAGELCERFEALHLIREETIEQTAPTYRGEGKTFL